MRLVQYQVMGAMQAVSPNCDKIGIEGDNAIYMYGTVENIHRAISNTIEKLRGVAYTDLNEFLKLDGTRDVSVEIGIDGTVLEIHTCFESE